MNLLIHKSKIYTVFKEVNAKKKVSIKWNKLLERVGEDKILKTILGQEKDTMIWMCDNKHIFYGSVVKRNEGYGITQMVGKEFDKRISACWFHNDQFYCINKPGDFISFDPKDLLNAEPKLETGNFATITTYALCNFVVGDQTYKTVVLADQYYRIRCYNAEDLHELHSTLSYKNNYVDKICQVSQTEVVCYWDDGSMLLLNNEALINSDNTAGHYLSHSFTGQIYMIAIDIQDDSTFIILEKDACRLSFSRINRNVNCIDIIRFKKLEPGFAYKLLKIENDVYIVKFGEDDIVSVDRVDLVDNNTEELY